MVHHTVEYYADTKKNEKELYELTWGDFQDILLSEESKVQNSMLPFMCKETWKDVYILFFNIL